jgi:hypothetical protein
VSAPEDAFRIRIVAEITKALATLLGTKHLYQSVIIPSDFLAEHVHAAAQIARWQELHRPALGMKNPDQEERHAFVAAEAFVSRMIGLPWKAKPFDSDPPSPMHSPMHSEDVLRFELPTIQSYCATCEARWPFNPGSNSAWHSQRSISVTLFALQEQRAKTSPRPSTGRAVLSKSVVEKTIEQLTSSIFGRLRAAQQIFLFPYQCQQCKTGPIFYLVRRTGLKLTLCGRDPIETVDLPSFLPKEQRQHFSGAVIAHNAGQTLAAIFLLRTFIEQFWLSLNLSVRSKDSTTGAEASRTTGDELGAAYSKTLPDALKSQFPSLSDLYGRLSVAMHAAEPNVELFKTAKNQIIEHFDARRLFKLHTNAK